MLGYLAFCIKIRHKGNASFFSVLLKNIFFTIGSHIINSPHHQFVQGSKLSLIVPESQIQRIPVFSCITRSFNPTYMQLWYAFFKIISNQFSRFSIASFDDFASLYLLHTCYILIKTVKYNINLHLIYYYSFIISHKPLEIFLFLISFSRK